MCSFSLLTPAKLKILATGEDSKAGAAIGENASRYIRMASANQKPKELLHWKDSPILFDDHRLGPRYYVTIPNRTNRADVDRNNNCQQYLREACAFIPSQFKDTALEGAAKELCDKPEIGFEWASRFVTLAMQKLSKDNLLLFGLRPYSLHAVAVRNPCYSFAAFDHLSTALLSKPQSP